MLISEIAATWQQVAATRSRRAKVAALSSTLTALADHSPDVLEAGTAMLTGTPRQGRIGVGWATLADLDVAAAPWSTLTVADVDEALHQVAATSGPGSVARRAELLGDLWSRSTADEQELLARLVLQELRQGALEGVVTSAVAAAAGVDVDLVRRAAMLTGDLTTTAVMAMQGGREALRGVRLQVGRPVQPMLATAAPDVATALATTGPARVDTKLDGMRIQVHCRDGEVSVFTRSLRDVTTELPTVVATVAELGVDAVVLDGEALAVGEDGRPLAFQDSMATEAGMAPHFFDILHLDGRDLLDLPLHQRLTTLGEVAGRHMVAGITVEPDDAGVASGTNHLRSVLAAGHEGIVVKALGSTWQAGRRGSDWVKVKVAHTLDLVVLAAEWGSGRRRGWLSNLHLAAIDADTGTPVMLGKTFKGLTDDLLAWQTEQLLQREVGRDGHVVAVRPELVVEIAFDGVQASSRYPGGVTLRFARVKRYRPDKTAADADTLATVRAIHRGDITATV